MPSSAQPSVPWKCLHGQCRVPRVRCSLPFFSSESDILHGVVQCMSHVQLPCNIRGGGITMQKGSFVLSTSVWKYFFPSICCKVFPLQQRGQNSFASSFIVFPPYFFHFTVNQKSLRPIKGRKLAVPPYFPFLKTDTLSSVTGPPGFAYPEISSEIPFSKATPKLPSTFFLQRIFQPMNPSLYSSDVYSSFFSVFHSVVFLLFLYLKILFNSTSFVNPKLVNK